MTFKTAERHHKKHCKTLVSAKDLINYLKSEGIVIIQRIIVREMRS